MEFFLIRHADVDESKSPDPYSARLSAVGREQAQELAIACQSWGIDMLCSSSELRALDTADYVSHQIPDLLRWDLEELENLTLDDLSYEPGATHLVSTWSHEQMERGLVSLWGRLTAAYQRIRLYAQANDLDRIAVVADERVLNLLIANWLGQDWRMLQHGQLRFDECMVCSADVREDRPTAITWRNHHTV